MLEILAAELADDPLDRGYDGMTDQQAADDLNTAYRSANVDAVSSADVYDAIVPAEYTGLTAAQKSILSDIFSLSEVRVQGNTRDALLAIFGAGTTTRTNLAALTTASITRAAELGLPAIHAGDVAAARA